MKKSKDVSEGGNAYDMAATDCEQIVDDASTVQDAIEEIEKLKSSQDDDADGNYAKTVCDDYISMLKEKGLQGVQMSLSNEAQDNMGFTDKQIKMAYGVLNDPRYKGGDYTGAVEVINKIAPGLADHPGVAKALQRTNEAFKESVDLSDKDLADAVFKAIDLANSLDVHYAVDKVAEFAEDLYSAVNGANEAVCSECKKPRFVAMPESIRQQYESVNEAKQKGVDGKVCWKGYKRMGTKKKGGKTVDNCVKM